MVLILTVLVLSILVVLGYAFSFSAGVNRRTARNVRDALVRECAAESALNYAVAMLEADAKDNDFDSLDEKWADAELAVEVGSELPRQPYGGLARRSYGGSCSIQIADEDGKLNVNRAVLPPEDPEKEPDLRPVLKRLIRKAGGADRDFEAIAAWLDPAHPLPVMSGLRAAPDIEPELFEEESDKPSLDRLLTTHPQHININTAPEEVLDALWDDFGLTRSVLDRRETEPFRSLSEVQGFLNAAGVSEAGRKVTPLLAVKSEFFTIRVSHPGRGSAEDLTVLVRRMDRQVEVLHVRRGAKEAER